MGSRGRLRKPRRLYTVLAGRGRRPGNRPARSRSATPTTRSAHPHSLANDERIALPDGPAPETTTSLAPVCEKLREDHQTGDGAGDEQSPTATKEDERDSDQGRNQDQPTQD